MLDIPAYLARISYDGPVEPTLPVLRDLHLAHLRAVPFENLDIHLNRPISLAEEALFDKIVRRRRGGFCYELNGLFAALLQDVGFSVTLLAAQFPLPPERVATEFDHLVLRVDAPGMPSMLADVAAGRRSFAWPLRIGDVAPQAQPPAAATFRLMAEGQGARLWRQEAGGEWEPVYCFTWQPRNTTDFLPGCHFHQTSPESDFTRKQICTLMTGRGRVTLSDNRLITTVDGARSEEALPDAAAVRAALRAHFAIDLDT